MLLLTVMKHMTSVLLVVLSYLLSASLALANPSVELTPEERRFIQQHPEIIVGGEMDWPPFDYVEDGNHKGVVKDYLKLIEQRTGLRLKVVTGYQWSQLKEMLAEQQLDVLPIMSWSPERSQKFNYTRSYLQLRNLVFTHSENRTTNRIEDLYGKVVAIPRGYAMIGKLEKQHPEIQIKQVSDIEEAINSVITNRADAVISIAPLINYYLQKHSLSGLRSAFAIRIGINDMHMATRKDMPILRDILQKALDSISDKTHSDIIEKWAGMDSLAALHNVSLEFSAQEKAYLKSKEQIRVCIDPNWMPYEGLVDGKHTGMSADYIDYFSQKLELPFQLVPTPSWKESLQFIQERRCDILPFVSNRPERRSYLSFTAAYVEPVLALATKENAWFYSSFQEIKGQRIGIVKGYSPGNLIRKRYPDIKLIEVEDIQQGLKMVHQGKLLGLLDGLPNLSYHIQRHYYGELKISGKFEYNWNISLGVRSDEPLLASVFNKLISHTPASIHQKISNNWIAVRYEEAVDYSLLWKILAAFTLILLLLGLRFRQMVRYRNEISFKNKELAQINLQLEKQTEAARHMAFHDLLTGLPNRYLLLESLDHAIKLARRQDSKLALLFLDLDRFKYINDSLGHHIGDELLKEVAHRVKGRLRSADTLVRLGGDEFVILLESLEDTNTPAKVAQNIIDTLQEPMDVAGFHLNISASIGIAFYPDDADNIHGLIKNADNAMYQAKELGRNRFRYYTRALSEATEKRLKTESALREALQKDQFHLVFQPIINLRTMEVSHAEALIRWQHPEIGFISPEYFIPIAEENGLIHDIGLWVVRRACQAYKGWITQGVLLKSVAINVSSVQFKKGNLTRTIQSILAEEDMDARSLEIEITERYLMDQTEHNIKHLDALKQAGHLISVDDFGVGYSSMSYMKRLPLDIIKIDRSFVRDLADDENDRQISQAIIGLSHNLGYRVVAEGVEHEAQLAFLQSSHCDFAQGYLFSKPLTETEFIATVPELNARLKSRHQQALEPELN